MFALFLFGSALAFKKFMLKPKLGTRGILGMLGIVGIEGSRKLDLSCNESLIALARELTCSFWLSNLVSSPSEEALDNEWYSKDSSDVTRLIDLGLVISSGTAFGVCMVGVTLDRLALRSGD